MQPSIQKICDTDDAKVDACVACQLELLRVMIHAAIGFKNMQYG